MHVCPKPIGDWLPDVDGRFLGETLTPRRWDGSKLLNVLSSGFEKVTEVVTAQDITSIVVNSLDLNAAKMYLLLFSFRNTYGSAGSVFIYFNDVTTGYNNQQLYSSGSTTSSSNAGTARYAYAYASQRVTNESLIMRTPDNYTLVMSRSHVFTGSAAAIFFHNVHWNNTANPTKVELRSEYANGIAAGSRLMIFKVKG